MAVLILALVVTIINWRALFRVEPHTACVAGVVYSFGVSTPPCVTRLPYAGALSRY